MTNAAFELAPAKFGWMRTFCTLSARIFQILISSCFEKYLAFIVYCTSARLDIPSGTHVKHYCS